MKKSKPTDISKASDDVIKLNPGVFSPYRHPLERTTLAQDSFLSSGKVKTADKPHKRRKNATEREFELILQSKGYRPIYEGIRLAYAENHETGEKLFYKADFFCKSLDDDPRPILFEVKGNKIWDRDLVRWKCCRSEWNEHFRFELHQKQKGTGWIRLH